MTPDDDFEDRLRDYVRGRGNVAAPDDLLERAQASRSQLAPQGRRFAPAFGLAAALIVAVLMVGTLYVGFSGHPGTASSPPTFAATPVGPVASDPVLAANGFPAEVLGLPVISVAQALALIAARTHQGRAMAVGGWWSQGLLASACPAPAGFTSVVLGYCSQTALVGSDVLVDDYQHGGNSTSESFQPPPSALLPRLVTETAGYDALYAGLVDYDQHHFPRRVVIIGHVGDARAWQCITDPNGPLNSQDALRRQCQADFVADAFAWVDGQPVPSTFDPGGPPKRLTPDQATAVLRAAAPSGTLVTLSAWTADIAWELDPRLGPNPPAQFWFSRALVGPPDAEGTAPMGAFVVDDGTGAVQTLLPVGTGADEPGVIDLQTGGGQPTAAYGAIVDGNGRVVWETTNWYHSPPAVLSAGQYKVVAWATAAATFPSPTPPARPACSFDVALEPGGTHVVVVSWDEHGFCSMAPTP